MNQAPKNKSLPALYRAIGEAISKWAAVERQLHQIFAICLTLVPKLPDGSLAYDPSIPSAVLNSIDGFRGKLAMIGAALESALGPMDEEAVAILTQWAVEKKKVNNLHRNRNALAHWQAGKETSPKGATRAIISDPTRSNPNRPSATETDIRVWGDSFSAAARRLWHLADRVASHQGLQRRHLGQAASQVLRCLPHDSTLLEYLKHELSDHLKP